MYVNYGCEQFSGETCHLIYLELGLDFQSQTMRCLRGVAESEVSDYTGSLCLRSPTLFPYCQAMKRVLHYMRGLESQLYYGILNQETSLEKNSLWDGCCILNVLVYKANRAS